MQTHWHKWERSSAGKLNYKGGSDWGCPRDCHPRPLKSSRWCPPCPLLAHLWRLLVLGPRVFLRGAQGGIEVVGWPGSWSSHRFQLHPRTRQRKMESERLVGPSLIWSPVQKCLLQTGFEDAILFFFILYNPRGLYKNQKADLESFRVQG